MTILRFMMTIPSKFNLVNFFIVKKTVLLLIAINKNCTFIYDHVKKVQMKLKVKIQVV